MKRGDRGAGGVSCGDRTGSGTELPVSGDKGILPLWAPCLLAGLSQAAAKAWLPHSSASKPGAAASSRWNDQDSKGPGDMWRGHAALPLPHPALDSSQPAFSPRDEIFMSAE